MLTSIILFCEDKEKFTVKKRNFFLMSAVLDKMLDQY